MNSCPHCGTQCADAARFCIGCGRTLEPLQVAYARPTAQPAAGQRPSAPFAPTPPAPSGAGRRMAPGSNDVTIALTNPGVNTYLLTGQSDYLVGRPGANNTYPDVDLSEELGAESSVSRRHVMIHVRADGVFVEDLESTNETIHNGFRLRPEQWYPLLDGDELRLGAVVLHVSIRRR